MYENQVRATASLAILLGHILIVLTGLGLLVLFGPFSGSDGVQLVLMASPILAITSISSLKYILRTGTSHRKGKKTNRLFSSIVIGLPVLLIAVVLALFVLAFVGRGGLGIDGLKLTLGAVETLFGGYLGLISESLFGREDET